MLFDKTHLTVILTQVPILLVGGIFLTAYAALAPRHTPVHAASTTVQSSVLSVDLSGKWYFTPQGGTQTTIQVSGGGWYKQGFTTVAEATYSRTITIPDTGRPQVTKIEFGAINHEASLYIDGQFVQTNVTSFTPSVFDITNYVTPGQTYTVMVDVKGRDALKNAIGQYLVPDAAEWSEGIPQGIFRSADLRVYPQIYIGDAFVRPSVASDSLSYDVWVTNASTATQSLTLSSYLTSWNGAAWNYPQIPDHTFSVNAGATEKVTIGPIPWGLGPASYWWPNVPYVSGYTAQLHYLNLTLKKNDGTVEDTEAYRFGFREVTQQAPYFYLNGVRVNFRGDNLQGADYDRIDYNGVGDAYDIYPGFLPPSSTNPGWPQAVDNYLRLNYNCVRIHQEPATPYMLNVADEKGLMIIDETAIRGSANMQDFIGGHDNMVNHVQDLVLRDRNHPSVVRWSQDNEPDMDVTDSLQFEQDLYSAIMSDDQTRPVSIDSTIGGFHNYDAMTYSNFSVIPHYVGGVGQYTDAVYVQPGRTPGQGEYIWPASSTKQGFTWFATATQSMRQQDASDLRPYALLSAWASVIPGVHTTDMLLEEGRYPVYGEDNLPDPWSNYQIERVQQGFNPVLVADKAFWDLNKYSDNNGDWPVATASYGFSQNVTRTLEVYNDTFSGTQVDVSWQIRIDDPNGPISSSGELHPSVPLGFHAEQTISFVTPPSGSRFYLVLSASKNGVQLFTDGSEYFLLTSNPTAAITIDDSVQGTGQNQFNYVGAGWSHCTTCGTSSVGLYNGTSSSDANTGDTASVAFNGTQMTLYGATGPSDGIGAVSIDGGPETSINFYSPAQAGNQALWTSPVLPAGTHTITLRVTGIRNASSSGDAVVVDRADIVPSPPVPPATPTPSPAPPPSSPTPPPAAPTITPTRLPAATATQSPVPPSSTPPSTSTPTASPAVPTGTIVAVNRQTATATAGPAIPTALPTASPIPRSLHVAVLPLTIVVRPRRIFAGDQVSVRVRTAPHARVMVTVQVRLSKVIHIRVLGRLRRVARVVVVYRLVQQGSTDRKGHFAGRARILYQPAGPVLGHVTVIAYAGKASAQRSAQFAIWPRRHHGAAHRARPVRARYNTSRLCLPVLASRRSVSCRR